MARQGSLRFHALVDERLAQEMALEAIRATLPRAWRRGHLSPSERRHVAAIAALRSAERALDWWEHPITYDETGSRRCLGCGRSDLVRPRSPIEFSMTLCIDGESSLAHGDFPVCDPCLPSCGYCTRHRPAVRVIEALEAAKASRPDLAVHWWVEPCTCRGLVDLASCAIADAEGRPIASNGRLVDPHTSGHLITAAHRGGIMHDPPHDEAALVALEAMVKAHDGHARPVTVLDGDWKLRAFLASGLERSVAASIAQAMEQPAILELAEGCVRAVDCLTHDLVDDVSPGREAQR